MTQQEERTVSTDQMPEFWPEAMAIVQSAQVGMLATTQGRQPRVRPVVPAYVGLNAYVLTTVGSPKTLQIADNELVELLHWTSDFRHLNSSGTATVTQDESVITSIASHFPYTVDDYFGASIRPPALIQIAIRRVSITTFNDIIADKRPRTWRIVE